MSQKKQGEVGGVMQDTFIHRSGNQSEMLTYKLSGVETII